ncbi:odorant receptor 83a-like [Pseudomyrmex gracilis]|uniref:odorant receptor 83a-like n=1 Tax=Pseudomyrmex gracilis TaxID=219809 RepID=UPI000994FB53|nr:odorant receptor 83a-like [Pseudomyrmex gracilis]
MIKSDVVSPSTDIKCYNDYSLQLNRWFLKSIGAWPQLTAPSTVRRIAVSMQIGIFAITTALNMIPCILYVMFENVNIESKLNAVVPLIFRLLGALNYCVLFKRNKDIYELMKHMEMDWKRVQRFDDREVMLQHARFGRFIAGMCAIFLYTSSVFFTVIKLLRTVSFTVGNGTFKMYPMTCPMYSKIIDARFSPVNEILLIVHITVYLSMSFNVFIFCYIGETLTEQCKTVGDVAYMTDWYKLPRKTALYFILIIMRSSKIIKMTAGKIVQLSIATFGDVFKTSMTYLSLLRTMIT